MHRRKRVRSVLGKGPWRGAGLVAVTLLMVALVLPVSQTTSSAGPAANTGKHAFAGTALADEVERIAVRAGVSKTEAATSASVIRSVREAQPTTPLVFCHATVTGNADPPVKTWLQRNVKVSGTGEALFCTDETGRTFGATGEIDPDQKLDTVSCTSVSGTVTLTITWVRGPFDGQQTKIKVDIDVSETGLSKSVTATAVSGPYLGRVASGMPFDLNFEDLLRQCGSLAGVSTATRSGSGVLVPR